MKPPFIAAFVVLAGLLASCSSSSKTERVAHPALAMINLEQPKAGWMGEDKNPHELVLVAVNGQRVTDQHIRGGKLLPPGWQTLTLSARSFSGESMGARLGGDSGAAFGARLDATASSRNDRSLNVNLQSDHDYIIRMKRHKDHFDFLIEDVATERIIGKTRD